MRPVPRPKHPVALAIFAGVSVLSGWFAFLDDRPSKNQIALATAALKRHDPGLFPGDTIYGTDLWQFHSPALLGILDLNLLPTRYRNPLLPFRIMAGPVVMLYLCGAYALFYRQCQSWSVAAFVAILSATVTYALGGAFWGIGSLASITPPGLCLALAPLILLAYLRYVDQWRLMLVFGFIGLCGNVHLPTSLNLALILLGVYLIRRRFAPASWLLAAGCVLFVFLGALPYGAYYLSLRSALRPPGAEVSGAALVEAIRLAQPDTLYPGILTSLLNWLLIVGVLVIPAIAVLARVERFHTRDVQTWVCLAGAALVVALGLQGLSQLSGLARGGLPVTIGFVQASSLLMLPIYVFFCQALTILFRLLRKHRAWLRWACAALTLTWMICFDNCRVARHALYDMATAFMQEADKPLRVQELHKHREAQEELRRIAAWAEKATNCPPTSVFLTGDTWFRVLSRRSILASADDLPFLYSAAPWRAQEASAMVQRQSRLLRPKAGLKVDLPAIKQLADELASQEAYANVTAWYAIVRAAAAPDSPGPAREIGSESWGRHFRLYRLRPTS